MLSVIRAGVVVVVVVVVEEVVLLVLTWCWCCQCSPDYITVLMRCEGATYNPRPFLCPCT